MTPTAGYVMTGAMSSVVIVVPESSMYSAQVQYLLDGVCVCMYVLLISLQGCQRNQREKKNGSAQYAGYAATTGPSS